MPRVASRRTTCNREVRDQNLVCHRFGSVVVTAIPKDFDYCCLPARADTRAYGSVNPQAGMIIHLGLSS